MRVLSAGLGALIALAPAEALGQACCAGAAAIAPARLALHEEALVGTQLKYGANIGSFDAHGRWTRAQRGASEHDYEEDILAALLFLEQGQLSFQIPIVETYRRFGGTSELGGGLGDTNVAVRWDFLYANESARFPGVALLLGLTIPTGRAADQTKNALGTDATGIGAVQASAGVSVEQVFFEHYLASLAGIFSQRLPRSANGVETTLGPNFAVNLALGYVFDAGAAVALVGHFEKERHSIVDGAVSPNSGRESTTLAVAIGYPIDDAWRVQGSLVAPVPISGLGQNQPAAIGGTLTLIRASI